MKLAEDETTIVEPVSEIKSNPETKPINPVTTERFQDQCSSVVEDPILIRFSGPLATRKFRRIERAFYTAIHASKTKNVELATKKMLSMNVSTDYKAIALLFRANCKALITGQMDEALLDCDRAIGRAKPLNVKIVR